MSCRDGSADADMMSLDSLLGFWWVLWALIGAMALSPGDWSSGRSVEAGCLETVSIVRTSGVEVCVQFSVTENRLIRFRPMLVTDCPRGLPVWPIGGVSDTISSRFLWCVRHYFCKVSRSGIKTVTATIAITQRLLGGTAFLLGGPQAGDAGGLA